MPPKSYTGKLVYNLYFSDVLDEWVIASPERDRATAREESWSDIKRRANDLLKPSGSAYVMFFWEQLSDGEWYIERVYVNRALRMNGGTASAETRRIG